MAERIIPPARGLILPGHIEPRKETVVLQDVVNAVRLSLERPQPVPGVAQPVPAKAFVLAIQMRDGRGAMSAGLSEGLSPTGLKFFADQLRNVLKDIEASIPPTPPIVTVPDVATTGHGGAAGPVHNFLYDVKLMASIRVNAPSEEIARYWLGEHLSGADANLGEWAEGPDCGSPILAGVTMDGEADLMEIDGEPL